MIAIKHFNAITLLLLAMCFQIEAANQKTWGLKHDQNVIKHLTQEDQHNYRIKLEKGQFVAGFIMQKSVDVNIDIIDPKGNKTSSFDNFYHHKEPFHFKTITSGVYILQVTTAAMSGGSYLIKTTYTAPLAIEPKDKTQQMMAHFANDESGGVIAVVKSGEIKFTQSYGLANVEYGIPIDVNTPFQLASASKPFTAYAIAMLENQNKLSLNDDVRKHLTWMPDFGDIITLRHLLNHSSGLKDAWNLWEMSGGRHDDIVTQQQILELIKNQTGLNFKPGERFQYNNSAYALLAEVVSKVSGQKFSQWMTQNIFMPLGMNSTVVLDNHQMVIKNRAYSYDSKYLGSKKALLNKSYVGAANVYSTVNDLSLWLKNLHTAKIGSQNIIESIQQPSYFNNNKTKNYSLGFYNKKLNGLDQIIQGGSVAGFRVMMNYYPKINSSVIVLANTPDFDVRSVANETAKIFFAQAMQSKQETQEHILIPGVNVKNFALTSIEEIILKQKKLKSLSDYIGTYYSEELNTIYKVDIENKLLVLKYHRGVYPFNPKGKDRFGLNDDWLLDWVFIFERDKNGLIQDLRLNHRRAHNVRFKRNE